MDVRLQPTLPVRHLLEVLLGGQGEFVAKGQPVPDLQHGKELFPWVVAAQLTGLVLSAPAWASAAASAPSSCCTW